MPTRREENVTESEQLKKRVLMKTELPKIRGFDFQRIRNYFSKKQITPQSRNELSERISGLDDKVTEGRMALPDEFPNHSSQFVQSPSPRAASSGCKNRIINIFLC
jgi:hypothetical protein